MSAYGTYIILKANKSLFRWFDCNDILGSIRWIEPFSELIHYIRPHKGQIVTAKW
jgi:histidine ammonia-lyase